VRASPRNHRLGIFTANPVIPQTTPKARAAQPENGTNIGYLAGFIARMAKNTPIPGKVANITRIVYPTSGESESGPRSKKSIKHCHVEIGKKTPTAEAKQTIAVIQRQIFKALIIFSFH
jgi:hypothetical protein